MTLSNWIELAILAVIVIAGALILRYFKRKLNRMNGFEGILTERGKQPRRSAADAGDAAEQLQELLNRERR